NFEAILWIRLFVLKGSRAKNSKQEFGGRTEAETTEESCLLACFLAPGVLSYLSHTTQAHQSINCTTPKRPVPLTSFRNQKNKKSHQRRLVCRPGQSKGGSSSNESSSFQEMVR
ncbi:hypothetical protein LEMLEM_LOCUS8333, partial [Lemmus lemmus]